MKTTEPPGQSLLTGLIFACPLGTAQSNCPLSALRKVAVEKRLEIIEQFSQSKRESILRQHKNCLWKNDIYSRQMQPQHVSDYYSIIQLSVI